MGSRWIGLGDAEVAHREAPRTYSIPRSEQRRALRAGDLVKLVFLADKPSDQGFTAERMWVEVREVTASGYVGALDNEPSFLDLRPGAPVTFGARHVIALHSSPSGLPLPYGQSALVTRGIVEDGIWPVEAVRMAPPTAESSGWIVRAQRGVDGELIGVWVDDLIEQFRVLDSVLDEPIGTKWVWDAEEFEYVAVPAASS